VRQCVGERLQALLQVEGPMMMARERHTHRERAGDPKPCRGLKTRSMASSVTLAATQLRKSEDASRASGCEGRFTQRAC